MLISIPNIAQLISRMLDLLDSPDAPHKNQTETVNTANSSRGYDTKTHAGLKTRENLTVGLGYKAEFFELNLNWMN